jgi:hypothetical protein
MSLQPETGADMNNRTAIEMLMELVVPVTESGCWLWIGETQDDYGHMSIDGKDVCADTVSWEAQHGSIPNGLCVCHKCNVRCCVNPNHLCLKAAENSN